jgi:hypothetical protein
MLSSRSSSCLEKLMPGKEKMLGETYTIFFYLIK